MDLFHWNDLPEYLKDNEYIFTGYRADMGWRGSLKSLFRLHNESGNVWTHLIGFFFFLFLLACITKAPPTPMALRAEDAEELWQTIAKRVHNTSDSLMHRLHSLQVGMRFHCDAPHLVDLQSDVGHGFHLHEGIQHSLVALEHRVHAVAHALAGTVHTLGDALRHPSVVSGSISNATGGLPHNLSEGVQHLRHGFEQSLAVLQHSITWNVHTISEELHSFDIMALPEALDVWLHNLVRKSVMWPVPRWPLYVFMCGAMSCLFLSAVCHLLGCCNRHISITIWRFDYAGIVANIVSSFYPSMYYIFLCKPGARWFYLTGISVCGALTLAVSLLETFQHVKWRSFRASCFVVLGLFGIVPWVHVMTTFPYIETIWTVSMLDMMMAASYLLGALIYATRVPERWFPGKFDLWFHSHQLFHLCVVLGAYLHYLGAMELLKWRDASGGCALDVAQEDAVHRALQNSDGLVDVDSLVGMLRDRLQGLWQQHGTTTALYMPSSHVFPVPSHIADRGGMCPRVD